MQREDPMLKSEARNSKQISNSKLETVGIPKTSRLLALFNTVCFNASIFWNSNLFRVSGLRISDLIQQHVMTADWSVRQLRQINVEQGIHFHSVRSDAGQSNPEIPGVVESAEQRIGDIHPFAVSSEMHHVGLIARSNLASQSGIFQVAYIPLLDIRRTEAAHV